jgi:MFS family permease
LRLVILLGVYRFDSPKYYIFHSEDEKALKVINFVYKPEHTEKVLEGLKREKVNEKIISLSTLYKKYKQQIIVCLMLCFLGEFTGLNAVNFYSTTIMLGADAGKALTAGEIMEIRIINTLMGALRTVAAFGATFFLDKFGRRTLYFVGGVIIMIAMGLMSLSVALGMSELSKATVLLFALGLALGYALINPLYYAECLPYKVLGFVVFADSSFGLMVVYGFPTIAQYTFLGLAGGLSIFCLVAAIGLWVIYKYVKETKGLTMDQIYDIYRKDNVQKIQEYDEEETSVSPLNQ